MRAGKRGYLNMANHAQITKPGIAMAKSMTVKNRHASNATRHFPADDPSTHSGTTSVQPMVNKTNCSQGGM